MSSQYLIRWDNGQERSTGITYFIEKALEDDEAEVIDPETDSEITSMGDVDIEGATA